MPRPRLPWFKLWGGVSRHRKVIGMSDRTFRVWVELLEAANEQKERGRFDSYAVAAAIIRRKPAEVRQVAEAGLMDETEHGVVMHDWDEWQRWAPEDGPSNHSNISSESLPKNSNKTRESLPNHSNISSEKLEFSSHAREDVDKDVEREEDVDVDVAKDAVAAVAAPGGAGGDFRLLGDLLRRPMPSVMSEATFERLRRQRKEKANDAVG